MQCSECLLHWNLVHLWTSLEGKRIQPTFSSMAIGRFLSPALRHLEGTTSWWLGTAKLRHRKCTMWPTTGGRDVSKDIMKEFTIVSCETQFTVTRNSKLAGRRKCIAMDKLAQEDDFYHLSREEFQIYIKNIGISH